jgi:hypothetical protein
MPPGKIIRPGQPIVHFNEVDECAGLDGLFTNRVHAALGQPVANTLHDLRWGDWDKSGTTDEYVWVFLISGSAPADHHIDGWAGSDSLRQPPMYFRLGGGSLRGIAKPGEIVWSRVFVQGGKLKMDIGRAKVITLPRAETDRRWQETTVQWPIMHAVTYGVTRDLMMARHQANHIQVAYAKNAAAADLAAYAKASLAAQLGLEVSFTHHAACSAPPSAAPSSSTIATTGTPKTSAMSWRHTADFAPPPVTRISFAFTPSTASRRRP